MMRAFTLLAGLILATASAASAQTLIVGNKNENTVSFFDLSTGAEVARRETGRAPHEIAVSPDGATAVLVSYRAQGFEGSTLHVFDVAGAQASGVIDISPHKGPHGLKWIPGTPRVIATTEITEDVVIVDVAARALVGSAKTDQQGTHMVALSPDATTAYASNIGSGSFSVIDIAGMKKVRDVKAGEGTEAISVSPDGARIYVGNNGSRSVMAFDARSFEKVGEAVTEGVPIRVEASPDGAVIAVSEYDKTRVVIRDAQTLEVKTSVDLAPAGGRGPVTLLFSPDGATLWAAATFAAKIVEIDTRDWTVRRTLDAGAGSDGLVWSPVSVRVAE